MGKSSSYRKGPSWQSNNTARGKEEYSRGEGEQSRPQGGEMSSGTMRPGSMKGARSKSKSYSSSVKTKTSFGQS